MRTILLGLNELSFPLIEKYIQQNYLPNFKKLFAQHGYTETTSEQEYKLLEPWIQWVTVHTGKSYSEHQVMRLGDIVERPDLMQIFEVLENKGYRVGAVSPFNAANHLKNPAFFVADPWTKTPSSGNPLLKKLAQAVSQAVNDNAQARISVQSILAIVCSLAYYTPMQDYAWYLNQLLQVRSNVATKALILDKLLSDVFIQEWKSTQPDFSLLFLNSGAHLQHHYLFNSRVYSGPLRNPEWYCPAQQDPLLAIYQLYDNTIGRLLKLPNVRLVLATGLSQQAHEELTFYWRLKEHAKFLQLMGINDFTAVHPRMSRDFLVEFADSTAAEQAKQKLLSCHALDKTPIFSVDNRGKSLFVELTYPHDITQDMQIIANATVIPHFRNFVAFVALKNGEHNAVGYYLDTTQPARTQPIPLTQVYDLVIEGVKAK
jgi:hypothetical protein